MKKTLIERIEVGSGGAASIEFTSIPADYTDLKVVLSSRYTSNGGSDISQTNLTFNNSASSYSHRILYGFNGSAASLSSTNEPAIAYLYSTTNTATANTFSNNEIYIPNYTGSSQKSVSIDTVTEENSGDAIAGIVAALWTGTSAISSLKLTAVVGNFEQYSSASLYGVSSGNDGTTTVS